jgi:hypothetical protein
LARGFATVNADASLGGSDLKDDSDPLDPFTFDVHYTGGTWDD